MKNKKIGTSDLLFEAKKSLIKTKKNLTTALKIPSTDGVIMAIDSLICHVDLKRKTERKTKTRESI